MTRPRYATNLDENHRIPVEYLRDRCGGFEAKKIGKAPAYTANYHGYKILLIDLSKYGGVLTDWLIQCPETNKFFWVESKTPEAYAQKDNDVTRGEGWLLSQVKNFRFCVEDADMEGILRELIF